MFARVFRYACTHTHACTQPPACLHMFSHVSNMCFAHFAALPTILRGSVPAGKLKRRQRPSSLATFAECACDAWFWVNRPRGEEPLSGDRGSA